MAVASWLACAGLAVWIGYERLFRRRQDPQTRSLTASGTDRGSTRMLLSAFLVSGLIVAATSISGVGLLPPVWRWIGVAVVMVGLLVRGWGMVALGRQYTRTVREIDEHQLVTNGPYAVVRHPGYAGSILVWCGFALAVGGWAAAAAVTVLLSAAYAFRIHAEEQLLGDLFGERYQTYRRRTRRLVPFVY
jgi:protein-S-isoprenylcysteine O-methyltransferase Ste14